MGLFRGAVLLLGGVIVLNGQNVPTSTDGIPKFQIRSGGLELQRTTHPGAFFDVVGRRAAIFGYENREAEAWVYPLELLDGLAFSFRLEGYPLDIDGRTILSSIAVRPEATTFVYAHAAFTVREIMFVPVDEPGIVILLDVQSVLPISITVSFRPRLRLMWPATAMTASIGWEPSSRVYSLSEETGRYAGVIGCPLGRDVSVMPYQEEPRDVPNSFVLSMQRTDRNTRFVPIVITGSVEGREAARRSYDRILASIPALYTSTADHYEQLDRSTLSVETPDERINNAFRWAKVGIDKGLATNPSLGTGLLAGFRTAGESERPGYAWFFGRDSMWTALATTAAGAFDTTRAALEFLRKYQRADGKIPHEISQSAAFIPWFDQYPYAWASADATPLYVIAHADYWQASADRAFIEAAWPSVLKAYRFSAATDTDRNDLIENTNVGHGWVEGGALYPPHEEMYMQALWIAASRGIADLASVMHDETTAADARAAAERTRVSMERTYWLDNRGFYAFATARPARIVDEDTVLPAVPLWFRTVQADRAQQEIDHLGSGAIETDWGARILSNRSALYDPLSYHYGSVWPLFTGWTAVGAYRYGRPHVGYDALMANVLLTFPGALGYVTELLSGDFATAFVLLDTSASMTDRMDVVHEAAIGFLRTLRAGDRGAVVAFSDSVTVVQPLTEDGSLLEKAIESTHAHGATALNNAIYIALKQFGQQAKLDGTVRRQTIAVLSDGEDTSSLVSFDDVLALARKMGVNIYTVALQSKYAGQRQAQDGARRYFSESDYSMKMLARETGAQSFFPSLATELKSVYASIAAELASQYSIGYVPANGRNDGRFRRVVVQITSRPELKPRTRLGYTADGDKAATDHSSGGGQR